jgi:hypoxanthine phosphoribosyltransferase
MTTTSKLHFSTAQAEFDQHQPDVIVGSSRGGAVALNINSKDTPLVLLCPAWKNWGTCQDAEAKLSDPAQSPTMM